MTVRDSLKKEFEDKYCSVCPFNSAKCTLVWEDCEKISSDDKYKIYQQFLKKTI